MSAISDNAVRLKIQRLEEEVEFLKKRVAMFEKYFNFIEGD